MTIFSPLPNFERPFFLFCFVVVVNVWLMFNNSHLLPSPDPVSVFSGLGMAMMTETSSLSFLLLMRLLSTPFWFLFVILLLS